MLCLVKKARKKVFLGLYAGLTIILIIDFFWFVFLLLLFLILIAILFSDLSQTTLETRIFLLFQPVN